jgi:hypothetical protein
MHETGKQLLKLMFREGETICVSPNKWGYHSVELDAAMQDEVTLLSTIYRDGVELKDGSCRSATLEESLKTVPGNTLQLCALNPIKGWREDANCTAFRNFLVECDYGTQEDQLKYVRDQYQMPFSAAVFSGGKSIHYLISLSEDLPNEEIWRVLAEWILAVLPLADQKTKNPSRSIRVPGAIRDGKLQTLVEYRGPVKLGDLRAWLEKYPECRPAPKKARSEVSNEPNDLSRLKPWARRLLNHGLDPKKGRNAQWFALACEFAKAGYNEDDTFEFLRRYFTPERDFKEREWKTAIRSGFKSVHGGKI